LPSGVKINTKGYANVVRHLLLVPSPTCRGYIIHWSAITVFGRWCRLYIASSGIIRIIISNWPETRK